MAARKSKAKSHVDDPTSLALLIETCDEPGLERVTLTFGNGPTFVYVATGIIVTDSRTAAAENEGD